MTVNHSLRLIPSLNPPPVYQSSQVFVRYSEPPPQSSLPDSAFLALIHFNEHPAARFHAQQRHYAQIDTPNPTPLRFLHRTITSVLEIRKRASPAALPIRITHARNADLARSSWRDLAANFSRGVLLFWIGIHRTLAFGAVFSFRGEDEGGFVVSECILCRFDEFVGVFWKLTMDSNSRTWVPRVDRWLGLSSNMIIMACGGLTYTYAVYSGHLKNVLHYTQEQTDDVGAAKDFGSVLGLLSGFFYNYYPPWVTICIGAALHLFGYSMVWMTLIGAVSPSFWLLCIYFTLGVGGDSYIDTGCIITTLESFGDHRGTAMGVLKAQVGLSGAMFVLIYEVFIEPDVDRFILLVALAPSIAGFALAFLTRPFPPEYQDEDSEDIRQRFRLTYGVLISLGVFLMIVITIRAYFDPGRPALAFFLTIMIVLASIMFTFPLIRRPVDFISSCMDCDDTDDAGEGIRLKEFSRRGSRFKKKPFRPELEDIHEGEESAALKSSSDVDSDVDDDIVVFRGGKTEAVNASERPLEPSLRSSLVGINFWLITMVITIGGGTGLAIINNFAQIGQALGDSQVDVYVGLISVWSCFGRLLGGYGSDFLLKRGYPRPVCLIIAQLLMCSCCLLLSTGWVPFLYVGSCLVGMAYGSHWSIQPPILAEVFGLHHFATLYKINSCGAPVGAYLLSAKVLGVLYDREAAVYRSQSPLHVAENTCLGTRCFGSSLLVLAFLCAVSAVLNFWFMMRTRPLPQLQPTASQKLRVQVD